MINDPALFSGKEVKNKSFTIKLTSRQRDWICVMAKQRGFNISQFIFYLIDLGYKQECKRLEEIERIVNKTKTNIEIKKHFSDDFDDEGNEISHIPSGLPYLKARPLADTGRGAV